MAECPVTSRHLSERRSRVNSKFYFKLSVLSAPGHSSSLPRMHHFGNETLHEDGTGLHWFGPNTYLELRRALPAQLVEHMGHFVLSDTFTAIQTLHQGVYEVKIESVVIMAELNCRPIMVGKGRKKTGNEFVYNLSVQANDIKCLHAALGVYDQIRQGKLQPVKSWDGPLPTT